MNIDLKIWKGALLVSAFFLTSAFVWGQNSFLELLPGADKLEYDRKTGRHRLIGNVNFVYQNNTMYCDSAYFFEKSNVIRAYGKVHVQKRDTLNLFCDSLHYNGNTKQAKLWGNVRVRDNEYKLTTDSLDYDAKKSQAVYRNGGRIQSITSGETLTSRVGYFHPDSKNFFFSHDVVYKSKELEMTTDTLQYRYYEKKTYFYGPTDIKSDSVTLFCNSGWYNTETQEGALYEDAWLDNGENYVSGDTLLYMPEQGISIGKGNVFMSDTTQKVEFSGDYAYLSDTMNYALVTGRALVTKYMDSDTLYVHADTLYTYTKDSAELVKAYHGARMFSNNVQCRADSIAFDTQKDKMELYYEPIVWSNGSELKGDFMEIFLEDSVIQHVDIYENASVLMEVAVDSFYNQIAGKKIIAKFKDNELYRTYVNGNAMTVFFPEESDSTDSNIVKNRIGMNRLYSSTLRIDVDSNEITGVTYIEAPDGAFYPMDQLNKEEQFIPGFNWLYHLRPSNVEALFEEALAEVKEPEDEPMEENDTSLEE